MAEDQEDPRLFIRDVIRRNERVSEAMIARLDEQRMASVDLRGEISDQRKQIQANAQAVLSVLDRFD